MNMDKKQKVRKVTDAQIAEEIASKCDFPVSKEHVKAIMKHFEDLIWDHCYQGDRVTLTNFGHFDGKNKIFSKKWAKAMNNGSKLDTNRPYFRVAFYSSSNRLNYYNKLYKKDKNKDE